MEKGTQDVYILGEEEGIVLRSLAQYEDTQANPPAHRKPGDTWMLKGPMEYIPTVEVEVVTTRKAIPLHDNEGIYVRNIKSGAVRAVIGHTYMLKVNLNDVQHQHIYLGSYIKLYLFSINHELVQIGYLLFRYRKTKNFGRNHCIAS